jgi:hypothetical protein
MTNEKHYKFMGTGEPAMETKDYLSNLNLKIDNESGIIGITEDEEADVRPKKIGKLGKMVLTAITAGVVGTTFYGSLTKKVETLPLTYQGWHREGGYNIMVFDPNSLYERGNREPQNTFASDLDTKILKDLKTGKVYEVTIERKNIETLFPAEVIAVKKAPSK